MKLLDTSTFALKDFPTEDELSYAILSHRWEGVEISLQDLSDPDVHLRSAYIKIQRSCYEAASAGFKYMWIDSCCIDKTSSADLSEAINSMYRWYQNASVCYAYLSDVDTVDDLASSAWFTRGWTLQELIAPKNMKFYNKSWRTIGTKHGLQGRLSAITGIPRQILSGSDPSTCSVAQRMSWAAQRVTTRPEDLAYSLLGLFDVNMPMLYGEGVKAFIRLQEEIIKTSDDHSIFAWSANRPGRHGLFAPSPAYFANAGDIVASVAYPSTTAYAITNIGLSITLPVMPWAAETYVAILNCRDRSIERGLMPTAKKGKENQQIGIFLKRANHDQQYYRVSVEGEDLCNLDIASYATQLQSRHVLVRQKVENKDEVNRLYGFIFRKMTSVLFPTLPDGERVFDIITDAQVVESDWSNGIVTANVTFERGRFVTYSNSNKESVWIMELPQGKRGTVVTFKLDTRKFNNGGRAHVALVKFGFDFDFNPLCMLWSDSSEDLKIELGLIVAGDDNVPETVRNNWITRGFGDNPARDYWETNGYRALRGNRLSGLQVELPSLNIRISITDSWRDNVQRAWIVDISAIELHGTRVEPPPTQRPSPTKESTPSKPNEPVPEPESQQSKAAKIAKARLDQIRRNQDEYNNLASKLAVAQRELDVLDAKIREKQPSKWKKFLKENTLHDQYRQGELTYLQEKKRVAEVEKQKLEEALKTAEAGILNMEKQESSGVNRAGTTQPSNARPTPPPIPPRTPSYQ